MDVVAALEAHAQPAVLCIGSRVRRHRQAARQGQLQRDDVGGIPPPARPRAGKVLAAGRDQHGEGFGSRAAEELTAVVWQQFVDRLARKKLTRSRIANHLAVVSAIYGWASRPTRALVSHNPTLTVELPPVPESGFCGGSCPVGDRVRDKITSAINTVVPPRHIYGTRRSKAGGGVPLGTRSGKSNAALVGEIEWEPKVVLVARRAAATPRQGHGQCRSLGRARLAMRRGVTPGCG
jgi:hypothetical protein